MYLANKLFQTTVEIISKLLFTNECTSDFLKNNIKTYVKIAPTYFGAVAPSSGSTLFMLAKVTFC
jgi:hypothetical protein